MKHRYSKRKLVCQVVTHSTTPLSYITSTIKIYENAYILLFTKCVFVATCMASTSMSIEKYFCAVGQLDKCTGQIVVINIPSSAIQRHAAKQEVMKILQVRKSEVKRSEKQGSY